ncbi:serine/arginine repetitive matrix protein 1 isoform X2 [Anguilla rostrata]|uniref:serine/arginine repetitive matrix protein 1 isoform X2 n=1 Tax=Anguilla rostrata TaxID=7938 RepID=UPI0030CD2EBB
MAENIRSLFDYREPPTLDSDGEGSKPPPPRGRGCGRKRKGTPVKVCDRVYVTEDEEESLSEHSYCAGDGQYPEGEDDRLPAPDSPYYLSDPAQLCVSELGDEGASGARAAMLYAPPANCRIREVHCGSQVRLVVIAIRDIAKGEEITVDYSLTEWGDNPMGFHSSVSPGGLECSSDPENNIKKEDESGPVPLSLSVSDYLTPSWSLSPSSSPVSHSEASDSDHEEEEEEEELEELRGRMLRRRKKRKAPYGSSAKRKGAPRTPSRPLSFSRSPHPSPPACRPSFAAPPLPPTTNINNNININIGRGRGVATRRQQCLYCGRHFRSLARHLEKHHAQQPEVRAAMERAQTFPNPPLSQTHPAHSNPAPSPARSPAPAAAAAPSPALFPREREAQNGGVSFSLSLSPPSLAHASSAAPPKKSPALSTSPRKSPSAPAPPKRGRRMKKEKEEEQEKREAAKEEEEASPHGFLGGGKDNEPEPNGEKDEESGEEKKGEMLSSRRPHMLPLLSSLSSLVAHLRRQQHSSFVTLSRQPQAAEAWRLLCHSSLALLILYNRRRECEVSKLTIQEYRSRVTPPPLPAPGSAPSLTPLEASLSPFERQVLCHLPRAGVLGKRGRVQPLILPPHSEPCLELLLQTRPGVGVDPQNPYLFARPYHSPATPLRGADLLRSLARASGTKNPQALTQTRVRRQVAILTQLLLLGEGEGQGAGSATQRLEDFLQREYHVTQSCARIGQDPGLMGRVGRVVLCGERDGVLFRGMSLHHICLELDVMSGNSADSLSDDSDAERRKVPEKGEPAKRAAGKSQPPRRRRTAAPPTSASSVSPSPATFAHKRRSAQPKPGKRGVLKRPWSEAERAAVEFHLSRNIAELRVPAKADCERCLQLCPLLVTNRRDWRAIKFYCHNRIQLLKKRERREGGASGLGASVC